MKTENKSKVFYSKDPTQICHYLLSVVDIDDDDSDILYERGYDDEYVAGTTYGKYDESYRYHPYAKEFKSLTVAEKKAAFRGLVDVLESSAPGSRKYEQAYGQIFAALYGFIAGLVSGMGKRYLSTTIREDLYQSAYLGVIKHIKKYDPSRGGQPSTFFFGHIRHELQECLRTVVGNGKYYDAAALRVQRVIARFENDNKTYTIVDISRTADLPISTVQHALSCINMAQASNIDELQNLQSDDDSPVICAENAERKTIVIDALNQLDDVQKRVIMMAHGFTTGEEHSVTQIAAALKMSPDCVKKALNKAKRELKKDDKLIALVHHESHNNDYTAAMSEAAAAILPPIKLISEAEIELIDDGINYNNAVN